MVSCRPFAGLAFTAAAPLLRLAAPIHHIFPLAMQMVEEAIAGVAVATIPAAGTTTLEHRKSSTITN